MSKTEQIDLAVLGAGPAGIGAAVEASRRGLNTVIIDQSPAAGGQVYRAMLDGLRIEEESYLGPDFAIGQALRGELEASSTKTAFGQQIWYAGPGFRIETTGEGGSKSWQARAVVSATGTYERVIPLPGWTTPGVLGLAATTILLKAQQMVPGENSVVAGCGPLVAAVAASIIKGGGQVAAMVDLSGPRDWLRSLPAMVGRPDLLARGIGWLHLIRRAGTPMLFRHAVTKVYGESRVSEVEVCPVDKTWRPLRSKRRTFFADSLALGHGLIPSTEVSRLLGTTHEFIEQLGGWIAKRDREFRTDVKGFYVAGDGAGVSGAASALLEGRIAGLSATLDLGKISREDYDLDTRIWGKALGKAERFGEAMGLLMTPRSGLLETITNETVICRCEGVTRGEIERVMGDGVLEVNQLKSWTRCGMGPCQGRMCGDTVARLVADRLGSRETAGTWTARVPIRPVPINQIDGDHALIEG